MANAKIKTVVTEKSVDAFINKVEPETKRDDCRQIMKLMADLTKQPAKMWGPAIVGFGQYHYIYESGREGDMPVAAFSPRKANIVLYIGMANKHQDEIKKLGKVKTGVGCLYLKKLEDVDINVLKSLIRKSIDSAKKGEKLN
jgi:hypothetical protein